MQYSFRCHPRQPLTEILISELADAGFESFVDTPEGFEAYISTAEDGHIKVTAVVDQYAGLGVVEFEKHKIAGQNWNAQWEADYPVVKVDNLCTVRAPFHQLQPGVDLDILVIPQMSFGTGHHATTWLMLYLLLHMDLRQKHVLDMGCGTGVLAIAAALRGAAHVLAIDIEDVAVENTLENTALNNVHVDVKKGGVEAIEGGPYDVILANINKNVLMADISGYKAALKAGGALLLSGFFGSDTDELKTAAADCGLVFDDLKTKDGWAALKFRNT